MTAEGIAFRTTLLDSGFQQAVDLGLKVTATAVLGEGTAAGAKKTKRHNLAHDIITDTYSIASVIAWREAIASDGVTDEASTQTVINNRISAIFDDMAGVSADDA